MAYRLGWVQLALCFLFLTVPEAANSEPDIFLQAVGFALTGSDDAHVETIDRAGCVFRIKSEHGFEIFHLNNIYVDRLTFSTVANQGMFTVYRTVVTLHGDATVVESTDEGVNEESLDPSVAEKLRSTNPDIFKPQHYASNETTLSLGTTETDRVRRAWEYIYSHGCAGKKSPF